MKVYLCCFFLCITLCVSACARHQPGESSLYSPGQLLEGPMPQQEDAASGEQDVVNFALSAKGTRPYTVLGRTYYPLKSAHGYTESGTASWYGTRFHGRKTSSGELYNQHELTAAHRLLPLGSMVNVTNLKNGRSVRVRINDRGPFVGSRIIDLSRAAAEQLGMLHAGISSVRVQSVGTVPSHNEYNGDIKGDFFIQVGAFAQAGNASRLERRLKEKGYSVANVQRPGRALHFVQVGPWKDLFAAQHALGKLRTEFPNAYVLAN